MENENKKKDFICYLKENKAGTYGAIQGLLLTVIFLLSGIFLPAFDLESSLRLNFWDMIATAILMFTFLLCIYQTAISALSWKIPYYRTKIKPISVLRSILVPIYIGLAFLAEWIYYESTIIAGSLVFTGFYSYMNDTARIYLTFIVHGLVFLSSIPHFIIHKRKEVAVFENPGKYHRLMHLFVFILMLTLSFMLYFALYAFLAESL